MIEPVATVGKLDDIQCIRSRVSRILKYRYQYRNTLNMRSHVQAPGVCYRSSLQGPVVDISHHTGNEEVHGASVL